MSTHLQRKHSSEPQVAKALQMAKNSKERRLALGQLVPRRITEVVLLGMCLTLCWFIFESYSVESASGCFLFVHDASYVVCTDPALLYLVSMPMSICLTMIRFQHWPLFVAFELVYCTNKCSIICVHVCRLLWKI